MAASGRKQTIFLYQRNGRYVIDGTSAVELDAEEDVVLGSSLHVVDRRKIEKKQRSRFLKTAATYMVMAMIVLAATKALFHYIGLQQELTVAIREVGTLESQISELATSNDQRMSDIQNAVDLEEIRSRAILDLGMTYAQEGQVIGYHADRANYVAQVASLD